MSVCRRERVSARREEEASVRTRKRRTHGRRPGCCRSGAAWRAGRRRCPGSLCERARASVGLRSSDAGAAARRRPVRETEGEDAPGGSIEQMISSLRSTRFLHTPLTSSAEPFSGTTHLSPSSGRQLVMAFENGRYGTSHSSSRLSTSPSLLPTAPSTRTKWPSGRREPAPHRSIETRNFWPASCAAWRVRIRIEGMPRCTGVAVTVRDDVVANASARSDVTRRVQT